MTRPWVYFDCKHAAKGPSRKALAVYRALQRLDPGGSSGGIFNNRRIRGSRTLSLHACGRAVDWYPSSHEAGQRLNHLLITQHALELDIQLIIWNRQQWGGRRGPRAAPYNGVDPHTSHLHIEVRPD